MVRGHGKGVAACRCVTSGAVLCAVRDAQNGDAGRCHVIDDDKGWTATSSRAPSRRRRPRSGNSARLSAALLRRSAMRWAAAGLKWPI